MTFSDLILEFREWAIYEGRYSMSTVTRDSRKIKELSRYFDVVSPRTEDIRSFFITRLQEGVGRQTLNVTRKALMKWFRFLNERHQAGISIRIPKQPEQRTSIKWIPTNDETRRIISAADNQQNREVATRDGAVMRILFSGGLRIGEVARINLEDLRSNGIFVRSEKREEDAVVGLSEDALNAIRKYLLYRRNTDTRALFTGPKGRINEEYLRQHISRLGKTAVKEFHPHAARHWIATFLLSGDQEAGIDPLDIRFVQTQLRHSSLASTQIYTHVNREENAGRVNKRMSKFFLEAGINTGPYEPEHVQAGPEGFEPPTYRLRVYRST